MRVVKLKLGLLSVMAGAVMTAGLIGCLSAPAVAATLQADAVRTEYLNQPIDVNGGAQKVIMRVRAVDLRDLLKTLAFKAGFNVLLDESVSGDISVDLDHVTINQALETIKDYADLVYMQDDKTLIVANKDSQLASSINQQVSQMIPVKYINAKLVSEILNNTVFASSSGKEEAASNKKASVEFRSNSVFIVGTDNDVRLAEELIKSIDVPRQSKTFKINHADVLEVAQLLQATIFNDGVSPFGASGAGTEAGGGISLQPTDVTVITENFEEGSGSGTEIEGASGGGGGGSSTQSFTLRTKTLQQKNLKISPEGPLIVPDTRSGALTIMGTIEQIALAEAVIPTLDQKLPQVAIETSLIDVEEGALRELQFLWGQQSGQWATGFNNEALAKNQNITAGSPAFQPLDDVNYFMGVDAEGNPITETLINAIGPIRNIIGLPTLRGGKPINANGSSLAFSTSPIDRSLNFLFQVNALVSKNKAKVLANPTVIAVHNTESVISITEEIVRRTTITRDATGFLQTQIEIGEAGIILNILPKVTGDGFVVLRVRPSVSTVIGEFRDDQNNVTTLLKRKDFAVQEVRVSNGDTLALGGLIDDQSRKDHSKIPGLGDLPIIGALFRTNAREQSKSELIMLVTPRVLEDDKPLISSELNQRPVSEVATNSLQAKKIKKDTAIETQVSVKQNEVVVPERKHQIEPVKRTEARANAYSIDDVMEEFGINDLDVDSQKDIDKSQIDALLNQYLPQGSK